MKILHKLRKFKKLNLKKITGKDVVLFLINRKLRQHFKDKQFTGKVTDLVLNRQQKEITFSITTGEGQLDTVTVHGYSIVAGGRNASLRWEKMSFDGPGSKEYRRVFQGVDKIDIPKFAVNLMQGVVGSGQKC